MSALRSQTRLVQRGGDPVQRFRAARAGSLDMWPHGGSIIVRAPRSRGPGLARLIGIPGQQARISQLLAVSPRPLHAGFCQFALIRREAQAMNPPMARRAEHDAWKPFAAEKTGHEMMLVQIAFRSAHRAITPKRCISGRPNPARTRDNTGGHLIGVFAIGSHANETANCS